MSKSYNDAKKELEKIVNQRRILIDSNKKLRAHPRNVNQTHFSELDDMDHQHDYRSSPRMSLKDSLNIAGPVASVPPPVNVYFRNSRDASFASPAITQHLSRDYDLTLSPTNVSIRCTANQARLGTASTVIGTFRQLQAKARKVEVERSDALKERLSTCIAELTVAAT